MSETIRCPNCSHAFEVSTALTAQLREQVRQEAYAALRQQEAALVLRARVLPRHRARRQSAQPSAAKGSHTKISSLPITASPRALRKAETPIGDTAMGRQGKKMRRCWRRSLGLTMGYSTN